MKQPTPALMLQGTSSNAGKSLLAAALCRIFTQEGLNVVPFKSQNMSLNACVTPDGLEMGRAQAVQAAACRRPPDVRMNPILLKPTSDMGSQVVLLGRSVGVMKVGEYWDFKPKAFATACAAYDELAAEADLVVLEGAGSPAEINLKQHDIVNMAMARHARARVLLTGDIDRGGVFAALVGTMALMDDWEKELVAGLIINKFRGDASLLPPALDFTTDRTGKPFLGIVPWIDDLNLPDEDSVTFKAGMLHRANRVGKDSMQALDIALLDLPRISNFTDVDALAVEPDVRVRIVRLSAELGNPDLVIIPGSKNTLGDLARLQGCGLAGQIGAALARKDGPVLLGICGGLQMLGRDVQDPHGLEQGGEMQGLGALDIHTTLSETKTLRRTRAHCLAAMQPDLPGCSAGESLLNGYEIHHGHTRADAGPHALPWLANDAGTVIGWTRDDGRVFGCYLHGLFDNDHFRRSFLDRLRTRRGLTPIGNITRYSLEPALDRLADVVRASLDMQTLRRLVFMHRA